MINQDKEKNFHPLINNIQFSEDYTEAIISSLLCKKDHQFLNDYIILGENFFPGAGYIELAGALTEIFLRKKTFCLEDMKIVNTLILNKESTELISKLKKDKKNKHEILIFLRGKENTLHASFFLDIETPQLNNKLPKMDLCSFYELDGADFYRCIVSNNINYGKTFRALDKIYLSKLCAYGTVQFNKVDTMGYKYYPPMIYSAFQLFTLYLSYLSLLDNTFYLPGFIDKIFYIEPNHVANNVYINMDLNNPELFKIFLCKDQEILMQINFSAKKTSFEEALTLTKESKNNYSQKEKIENSGLRAEISDFLENTLSGIIFSNRKNSHALIDLSSLIIISATRIFSLFK